MMDWVLKRFMLQRPGVVVGLNQEQEELLALIRKIWEGNPSLRLFQLFGNCLRQGMAAKNAYYVSDGQLILSLKQTYNMERYRD